MGSIIRVQFSGWQLLLYKYIILQGNSLSASRPRVNYLGDNFRVSNFRGAIIQGAIILGGNYPGGQLSGGQLSREQLSGGQLSWGNYPGAIIQGAIVLFPKYNNPRNRKFWKTSYCSNNTINIDFSNLNLAKQQFLTRYILILE